MTDWPGSRHISGMNRSACVFALILGLAACNDPTNIGEQDTDGASGTGETADTTGGVTSGSSATTDPSASSQGSSSATTSGKGSTTTIDPTTGDPATGESSGGESSSEETGLIDPPDGSNVIYLNFGGVTLTAGTDSAPANTTSIGIEGDLNPYQFPDDIPEIAATVEAAWSGINVVFVTERPAEGDFTMLVITPTNSFGGGVQGIASLDCGNTNPNSTAAAFTDNAADPESVASVISRELGYTYGLENIDDDTDFMNGNFMLGTEFADDCHDFSMQPPGCAHVKCPGGQQNSYAELVSRLASE